jgi:hypothetical protein
LLQQVNNQLVHDFLSQQNNKLFLFLSELMDLFVTSQQPISHTTWLKVTPHCNYFLSELMDVFVALSLLSASTS